LQRNYTGQLQRSIVNRISVTEDKYNVLLSAGDIDFDLDDEANDGSEGTLQYDEVEGGAKQASSKDGDDVSIWHVTKKKKKQLPYWSVSH
jgi:hypothetical protein